MSYSNRRRTLVSLLLATPVIAAAGTWYVLGTNGGGSSPHPDQQASPRSVAVADLKVGDCFFAPDDETATTASFGPPTVVWVVPCGEPHRGEVYAVAELHGTTNPGGQLESYRECEKLRDGYAPDRWAIPDNAMPGHLDPPGTDKQHPGRSIAICTFDITGGMTSTLRQDRSRLTPHQLAYLEAEDHILVDRALIPGTSVELAPDAYRAWLADLLRSVTATVQVLDSHPWGSRAEQPAADRAAELRHLLQQLQAAQQSADSHTLKTGVYAALATMNGTTQQAALRAALGLPSTPPRVLGDIRTAPTGPAHA